MDLASGWTQRRWRGAGAARLSIAGACAVYHLELDCRLLFGCGAVTAALSIDWFSWRAQGIDPEHTSQGAMSHAMLALQAQLVAVVVVMTIYLAAARRGGW
jgi:hypothetical protein